MKIIVSCFKSVIFSQCPTDKEPVLVQVTVWPRAGGDYLNQWINLLQINEREKFDEFFDLMCTNNFFPKITLPTRSSKRSCTLIDQMFCKLPHLDHANISSAIIMSNISDHFPCLVKLEILKDKPKRPKYIQKRIISEAATHNFREELGSLDISSQLSPNLMTDPNPEYDIFERITVTAYEKHFPYKRVKVNKYKHKLSPWITAGLIKSIEFRDKLYKRLKSCPRIILNITGWKPI